MTDRASTSETDNQPPAWRRWTWRRTIWLTSFIGVALPFAYFWSTLFAPYPAVEISKETTWCTGPVDEEGYVNYPAALRDLTAPDQKEWNRDLIRDVLYRDFNPASRRHYPDAPCFTFPVDMNDVAKTDAVMPFPRIHGTPDFWADHTPLPYSSVQRPIMAKLVAENAAWFDELTQAAKEPWRVPDWRVPGDLPVSPLFGRLAFRIQLNAGEGRTVEAFNDIDTLRAFAARQPQHPEPMMGRTAMEVETMACIQASLAILHCDTITDNIENWVNAVPQQASLRKTQVYFSTILRAEVLNEIQWRHRRGPPKIRFGNFSTFIDTARQKLTHEGPDWNRLLRLKNQLFDTLSEEMFHPTGWPQQRTTIDRFNKTIPNTNGYNITPGAWELHGFDNEANYLHTRTLRSTLYMARDLVVATHRLTAAYRLVHIALALKRWQIQHGTYPDTLQQLADANLITAELLTDPFSEKPFLYQQTQHEFRLYSTGQNMLDDFGVPQYLDIPVEHKDNHNRDARTARYPDDTPSILWKR